MIKEALGKSAFYGKLSPACFVTDNCVPLINALESIWPESECFKCLFHILKQVSYMHSIIPIQLL